MGSAENAPAIALMLKHVHTHMSNKINNLKRLLVQFIILKLNAIQYSQKFQKSKIETDSF